MQNDIYDATTPEGRALEGLRLGKQNLAADRAVLHQEKIANLQLAVLNLTNLDIAQSNRRIAAIERQALDQAQRQTALLELQMEQARLAKLERTRQLQLKEAAFVLSQEVAAMEGYPPVPRYILLKRTQAEAARAGLTAEGFEEIADKEYAGKVLGRLAGLAEGVERETGAGDREQAARWTSLLEVPVRLAGAQAGIAQAEQNVAVARQALNAKRKPSLLRTLAGLLLLFFFGIGCLSVNVPVGILFIIWGGWLLLAPVKAKGKEKKQLLAEIQAQETTRQGLETERQQLETYWQQNRGAMEAFVRDYPELKRLTTAG